MRGKRAYSVLSVIVPVLIGVILGTELKLSYDASLSQARQHNASIASVMAARVDSALTAIDYLLRDVLDGVTEQDLAFRGGPGGALTRRLNEFLLGKIRTHDWLFGLGVMNRSGVFVGSVNREGPQNVGESFSYREYFSYLAANTNRDVHATAVFTESVSGESWISMARTVRLAPGRFDGVIFAGISEKALREEFGRETHGPGMAVAVLDRERGLIFRKPEVPGRVGKKVDGLYLDEFISGKEDTFSMQDLSPLDGTWRLVAMQKCAKFPYLVIVSSQVDLDLADWRRKALIYAAGWLVIAAMIIYNLFSYRRCHSQAGELVEMNRTLLGMQEGLQLLATTDSLTGCHNRRRILEIGLHEFNRAARYRRPFSLLMIDIDRFKTINDTYGHAAGDRVLQALSEQIRQILRSTDFLGRLGGEEFAVILPETGILQAVAIAERIRTALSAVFVSASSFSSADASAREIRFTVSVGVAEYRKDLDSFEAVLSEADRVLYRAKQDGRNRVAAADPALS